MTQNKRILDVIEGSHVLGIDGLRDYHTVQAVKNSLRKRSTIDRFNGVRSALKNYRVTVSHDSLGRILIYRADSNQTLTLA